MLYNVVIVYQVDGVIKSLDYTSQNRADCEYRAIRYITSSPLLKVISITFTEEK